MAAEHLRRSPRLRMMMQQVWRPWQWRRGSGEGWKSRGMRKSRALETRRVGKAVEDSGALGNRVAAPHRLPCLNIGGCTTGRSEINGHIGSDRESYGGRSGINGNFLFTVAPDSPAPLSGVPDLRRDITVGFLTIMRICSEYFGNDPACLRDPARCGRTT